MPYAIRLEAEDLARIRLGRLDPIWELTDAAHLRLRPAAHLARSWMSETRSRLGPRSSDVVRDLRSGAVQYLGFGILPTSGVIDFGRDLETALRLPTRRWVEQLRSIDVPGWHLPAPGIATGLARLERSTLRFYDAAIGPYWPAMAAEADRVVAAWAVTMAREGIGALLSQLHPQIRWQPPYLIVDAEDAGAVCPPGCVHIEQDAKWQRTRDYPAVRCRPLATGLLILPTVFGESCITAGKPRATAAVSVPIPVGRKVFDYHSINPHHAEALLGACRAWVLQACTDGEVSTSALARRVGVSVSSASEHARVLRRSGLIVSTRSGQAVLHSATTLGRQLMAASDANDGDSRQFLAKPALASLAGRFAS